MALVTANAADFVFLTFVIYKYPMRNSSPLVSFLSPKIAFLGPTNLYPIENYVLKDFFFVKISLFTFFTMKKVAGQNLTKKINS